MMDLYQNTLAAFLTLNIFLFYRSYLNSSAILEESQEPILDDSKDEDRCTLQKFKWRFFPIYLLVNGSDWLHVCLPEISDWFSLLTIFQGPYIYPIYKGTSHLHDSKNSSRGFIYIRDSRYNTELIKIR